MSMNESWPRLGRAVSEIRRRFPSLALTPATREHRHFNVRFSTVGTLAVIAALALSSIVIEGTAQGSTAAIPVVACTDVANPGPLPGKQGYRLVLGVIAAPPAYIAPEQVAAVNGFGSWTYWLKAGMGVRVGRFMVTVTIPQAWRSRAAITWGNSHRIVNALKFSGCGAGAMTDAWNGYSGGFYLRASSGCVPLVFSVGGRSTTKRFGIGRPCA